MIINKNKKKKRMNENTNYCLQKISKSIRLTINKN